MATNQSTVATRPNEAAKPPANKLLDLIASPAAKKQFALALPRHITPDLMARICLTAINKVPKLAECTQETLFGCIMDLAQMGLVPDNRTAYLIPRWSGRKKVMECTYIVGYQGFIELAYRHPLVKGIRFNAVYEKDYFDYEDGLESRLVHRPSPDEDAGPLVHAWAVCELEGGGRTFVVIGQREVRTAKAMQPDSDKPYSPWVVHEAAMWQKTAVRALSKRMPRSAELMAALEADDSQANRAAIDMPEVAAGAIGGGGLSNALEDARREPEGGASSDTTSGEGGNADDTTSGGSGTTAGASAGPTLAQNRAFITKQLAGMNIGKSRFVQALVEQERLPRPCPFDDLNNELLQSIVDEWDDFKEKVPPQ